MPKCPWLWKLTYPAGAQSPGIRNLPVQRPKVEEKGHQGIRQRRRDCVLPQARLSAAGCKTRPQAPLGRLNLPLQGKQASVFPSTISEILSVLPSTRYIIFMVSDANFYLSFPPLSLTCKTKAVAMLGLPGQPGTSQVTFTQRCPRWKRKSQVMWLMFHLSGNTSLITITKTPICRAFLCFISASSLPNVF